MADDLASNEVPGSAATGQMARVVAGRLSAQGYQVRFRAGRDPAAFMLAGLPGDPEVEVTAEEDGRASCHYTGRTLTEAAKVIARLLTSGRLHPDTVIGTWDGIIVEWHFLPRECQPAGSADDITAALLAHLAVLAGGRAT